MGGRGLRGHIRGMRLPAPGSCPGFTPCSAFLGLVLSEPPRLRGLRLGLGEPWFWETRRPKEPRGSLLRTSLCAVWGLLEKPGERSPVPPATVGTTELPHWAPSPSACRSHLRRPPAGCLLEKQPLRAGCLLFPPPGWALAVNKALSSPLWGQGSGAGTAEPWATAREEAGRLWWCSICVCL